MRITFDPISTPYDRPLDVDNVLEFHVARLVVLMRICSFRKGFRMQGRTKLAKLDFFIRYPEFLEAATVALEKTGIDTPRYVSGVEGIEAGMIRYRYGPWDHRYYNLLATMVSRNIVRIGGSESVETYSLTSAGKELADVLIADPAFEPLVERCQVVSHLLAPLTGSQLKEFVYESFETIALLPIGSRIESAQSKEISE